jgi:hypothetical protein
MFKKSFILEAKRENRKQKTFFCLEAKREKEAKIKLIEAKQSKKMYPFFVILI